MADVELLPLPECDVDYTVSYSRAAMRAYARANLAPLQAENDRLRAEVERLAGALRGVMHWDNGKSEWDEARAALAQEDRNG